MRNLRIPVRTTALLILFWMSGFAQSTTQDEEIVKAVLSCNVTKAKDLIRQRPDLLAFKFGHEHVIAGLLHHSASCTGLALAQFLIEEGTDVKAIASNGWTPLHNAARFNNHALVKLLVAHRADPNARDTFGYTPLFLGNAAVAKVLLENGANPNLLDKEQRTILHYRPEKALIEVLEGRGYNFSAKDPAGKTPLHIAVAGAATNCSQTKRTEGMYYSTGGLEDVHALVAAGADVNARDSGGQTPLMAGSNFEELAQLLISKGADVNAQDGNGYTVLHHIVLSPFPHPRPIITDHHFRRPPPCSLDLVPLKKLEFFLTHGANPELAIYGGYTVLAQLAKMEPGSGLTAEGLRSAIKLLHSHRANLNATDRDKNTVLHLAASAKNSLMVQFLLERGIKPNLSNSDGQTPLHKAEDARVAELLLKYKADPNIRDKNGQTPLYPAAGRGLTDVVKLLLAAKADTSQLDTYGNSPLHIAAGFSSVPIMELLVNSGIRVNRANQSRSRPLHYAAASHSLEAVEFLLAHGAEVNARDKTNRTALHQAIANYPKDSMVPTVKLLLEHGVNPNLRDFEKRRALDFAKVQRQYFVKGYSFSDRTAKTDEIMGEIITLLEGVTTELPLRTVFGQITMEDGTPVNARVMLYDEGESPYVMVEQLDAKDGRFEFRLDEGRRFRIYTQYNGKKDGEEVLFLGRSKNLIVKGDVGPVAITLDHFVRKSPGQ